jgi:hypothetical protein
MKKKLIILLSIAGLTAMSLVEAIAQNVVYASNLYNSSKENEVSFDSRYTGKTVKVQGKVLGSVIKNTQEPFTGYSLWLGREEVRWTPYEQIGVNPNGSLYTYIDGESYTTTHKYIRLFISESNARQFANVRDGDEIIISGRCIGKGGSLIYTHSGIRPEEVFIDNCILIKSNAEFEKEKAAKWEAEAPMREAARKAAEAAQKAAEAEEAAAAKREAERKVEEARKAKEKAKRDEAAAEEAMWRAMGGREAIKKAEEERRKNGLVEVFYWDGKWKKMTLESRPKYSGIQEGVVSVKVKVYRTIVTDAKLDKRQTTIKDKSIQNSVMEAVQYQTTPFFSSRETWHTFQYKFSK